MAANNNLIYIQNPDLEDISKPAKTDWGYVSFGFECEFSNNRVARDKMFRVVNGTRKVRTDDFPFLDGTWIQEESGNWEVRSSPYLERRAIIANVIRDIKEVKRAMGEAVRSFHLHMRFPLDCVPPSRKEAFRAWIARVGDAVLFWRLQRRDEWYALVAWCMTRQPMKTLHLKGPIRLQMGRPDRSKYDLELRGFMKSGRKIQQMTQIVVSGIIRGNYNGYASFQLVSSDRHRQERITHFFRRYRSAGCRRIGQRETALLERLRSEASRLQRGNVILYDLENAPYFSSATRTLIAAENRKFVRNFNTFFEKAIDSNSWSKKEQNRQYRRRLKNWAIAINLHDKLLKTL
mmetsp:Transcript_34525/g.97389  ORF Transcript_34525/g.97389 Transcript_34525/m.97389 type:complete len:348 (-) Transcript_34525:140-1183(-)|eukprot:CAMPEP_0119127174 /NCGR_PEP_ID=MMETSP1310-20130426/5823_1 /TAXON_ID=464262 /ORGANISM="Genus nov. species nov., Strain RCC2339" /LENGTH=347 /DNA_ID=CAMNT_0007117409 /DNA_START=75 /DNA_END=1118 /DNA_ORIENTATION=-